MTRTVTGHRSVATGMVVAALLTSSCSGPRASLDVSTLSLPISLVLGQHKAVSAAPVGPLTVATIDFPRPAVIQIPSDDQVAAQLPEPRRSPPSPCPDFDPLSAVVGAGVNIVAAPTAPATYSYRAEIVDTVGADKKAFSGGSSWTVGKASAPNAFGDYSFTVTSVMGNERSTRTFLVVKASPGGQAPPALPRDPTGNVGAPPPVSLLTPGFYLGKVVNDRTKASFTPTPPLPLARFPLVRGQSFSAAASDGTTSMSYVATVKGLGKVNACGEPAQGWSIELTEGRITQEIDGVLQSSVFVEALALGTQYGGLILSDSVTVSGTLPTVAISRTSSFKINELPAVARP